MRAVCCELRVSSDDLMCGTHDHTSGFSFVDRRCTHMVYSTNNSGAASASNQGVERLTPATTRVRRGDSMATGRGSLQPEASAAVRRQSGDCESARWFRFCLICVGPVPVLSQYWATRVNIATRPRLCSWRRPCRRAFPAPRDAPHVRTPRMTPGRTKDHRSCKECRHAWDRQHEG